MLNMLIPYLLFIFIGFHQNAQGSNQRKLGIFPQKNEALKLTDTVDYDVAPRILFGQKTPVGKYPYVVQVFNVNSQSICGGSILRSTMIITAAHCLSTNDLNAYIVLAGTTKLLGSGVLTRVAAIYIHPKYVSDDTDFDVALLQLPQPLNYSATIQPIKLSSVDWESYVPPYNVTGTVVGWGLVWKVPKLPSMTQREVTQRIVPHANCSEVYEITDRQFCASFVNSNGHGAAFGDSGGPFVINGDLYGVVSFGPKVICKPTCKNSVPSAYTRLTQSEIRQWIQHYIDNCSY